MAERSTNTIAELSQRIMKDIGQYKLSASEDEMPFLQELEDFLISKNREPIQQMQNAGLLPSGQQMDPAMAAMGMAGPAGMGAPPNAGFQGSGGVRGVVTGPPPITNTDELRRMLTPR